MIYMYLFISPCILATDGALSTRSCFIFVFDNTTYEYDVLFFFALNACFNEVGTSEPPA